MSHQSIRTCGISPMYISHNCAKTSHLTSHTYGSGLLSTQANNLLGDTFCFQVKNLLNFTFAGRRTPQGLWPYSNSNGENPFEACGTSYTPHNKGSSHLSQFWKCQREWTCVIMFCKCLIKLLKKPIHLLMENTGINFIPNNSSILCSNYSWY